MPHRGGRVALFTAAQETLIVDMVRENNLIRLREIRDKVIADNVNFESIDDVSLATIDRVLRRQKMRMKQVYRVPFERNSARHKDLRYEYVQVIEITLYSIQATQDLVHGTLEQCWSQS
ncbi:receptor-type tyrosine- phosphatase U-like protein [Labeo rohita]|uniref:Receptor-type tyrosine-phosphatase U-like protein n=1 Tax=Labeo rohita TaxID=84645 RepID=A0A498N5D0_LABRO|nr:receptor-type tyrosine- phosphatase U-like protein [Labeo rohita]